MARSVRGSKSPGFDYDGRRGPSRRTCRVTNIKRATNRCERRKEPLMVHHAIQQLAEEQEQDHYDALRAYEDADLDRGFYDPAEVFMFDDPMFGLVYADADAGYIDLLDAPAGKAAYGK